jgi:hypothetical protein
LDWIRSSPSPSSTPSRSRVDQTHDRLQQVGPAHQKTRQLVSRPSWPDMQAQRREDSLACMPRQFRRIKAARIRIPYCNRHGDISRALVQVKEC